VFVLSWSSEEKMLELETKITFHNEVSVLSAYLKRGLTVALQLTNTAIEYEENTNFKANFN